MVPCSLQPQPVHHFIHRPLLPSGVSEPWCRSRRQPWHGRPCARVLLVSPGSFKAAAHGVGKKKAAPRCLRSVLFPFPISRQKITPHRLRLHLHPTIRGGPGCCAQLPCHWLPSSDPLHLLPFPSRLPGGLLGRSDRLSKAEVTGPDVVAGGGGTLPGFLVTKNRYAHVHAVLPQEGGAVRVRGRGSNCRRYVFARSVFASLIHVLVGYGA